MATRDLAHSILPTCPIKPAATTTTVTGATANSTDMQGYEGLTAIVNLGTWTDGTFNFKLVESDDNTTFTDVAAGDLIGTFTAVTSNANVNKCQWVGYKGGKRYVAVTITVTASPSTGMVVGTTMLQSHARHNPTF